MLATLAEDLSLINSSTQIGQLPINSLSLASEALSLSPELMDTHLQVDTIPHKGTPKHKTFKNMCFKNTLIEFVNRESGSHTKVGDLRA